MACITGGIAEASYKSIPDHILESVKELLNSELLEIIEKFEDKYGVL
jgi:ADP-ribosylglycohydrolase